MFFKSNKSENFTPGFICVLHTFGRSLQWNPHIHVLLSEGGVGNKTVWRPIKHFNYKLLRNSFRTALLNKLEQHFDKLFFAIPKEKRRFLASLNTWRTSLLLSFGYDPLLCKCGHPMSVLEICHKGTSAY